MSVQIALHLWSSTLIYLFLTYLILFILRLDTNTENDIFQTDTSIKAAIEKSHNPEDTTKQRQIHTKNAHSKFVE